MSVSNLPSMLCSRNKLVFHELLSFRENPILCCMILSENLNPWRSLCNGEGREERHRPKEKGGGDFCTAIRYEGGAGGVGGG
jgi:hypothetical protein